MVSFYPGPSRVHDDVPRYVKDAHRKGILSLNHRSEEFMSLAQKTIQLLKDRLSIPKTYTVFFTSSATECWEIIAQSLIRKQSLHLFNGAFGEKWFDYTKRLRPDTSGFSFEREDVLLPEQMDLSAGELICLTQNETSNGTQLSNQIISVIHKKYPEKLIAIDATSSMGGIQLDFKQGDIWLASVQKCFGLPAGLGLMICSSRAVSHFQELGEKSHYNSLLFMKEMMDKWQTPFTPNVLGIYLLMRTLKKSRSIREVEEKLINRYTDWKRFFSKTRKLELLIRNESVRSVTVLTVKAKDTDLEALKRKAKKAGFLLGEGYGSLKKETFRIANFPAIKSREIRGLMKFFMKQL